MPIHNIKTAAKDRCRRYRRRILDISQQTTALHIGSAFSCLELVDCCYHELMKPGDTFLMSKGHGWLAQAVVLEDLGILDRSYLDTYGTAGASIGVHPDLGIPGIAAATGSLGHGLPMAVGMALADREHYVYVVLSDGELQEGSTWEAVLLASSHRLSNLIVLVDNNDLQSLGRTSETHPSMYPISPKFEAFGWEAEMDDGHKPFLFRHTILARIGGRPFALVARTVKGKGVSFMENQPVWHYRSPTPDEYRLACEELDR